MLQTVYVIDNVLLDPSERAQNKPMHGFVVVHTINQKANIRVPRFSDNLLAQMRHCAATPV